IALIHGLMSDEGLNGGDVFLVPVSGDKTDAAPLNLTPNLRGSVRSLTWRSSGDLLITEYSDGKSKLDALSPANGSITTLSSAVQNIIELSSTPSGELAMGIVESFAAPQESYGGPIGHWTKLTSTNSSITPMWGEARSLHWKSDSFQIQGWLLYPLNFDPSKQYPMVVSVHGGPSSASWPAWPGRWNAVLPSQGYFILLPNFRGSYGNGEVFTKANVKDFGYGDLRDILSGVDAAIKEAPIDPKRIGIIGWSYGGYMAMWGVTQTDRFQAAVAGAGIASWQSYYGQNR